MRRNREIVLIETEDDDPANSGDIREIEQLFANILFETWMASRGTPPGASLKVEVAA